MSLNIPDPQNVLAELSELVPVVYSALDYGALKAREFFEREDENHRMDRALGPNLVRYFTRKALERVGQDVQDEQDFELEPVPNNGLCLTFGRYRIRVLKSDAGDLPVPGHSKSRQAFYQQTTFTFTPEG